MFGARFSLRLGPSFDRRYGEPLTYMTRRSHLDAFLAQAAAEVGADFHDADPVRDLEIASVNAGSGSALAPAVTVRTAGGSYAARVLVGADGANGIVGRGRGDIPPASTRGWPWRGTPPSRRIWRAAGKRCWAWTWAGWRADTAGCFPRGTT